MLKKLFIILLSIILAVSCVGCNNQPEQFDANGYPEATEFKMYSYYGDNDFAKFISEHDDPWHDENIEAKKRIKVAGKKIDLVYEYSEFDGLALNDKYLWVENPAVKVYFFHKTNDISKICTEDVVNKAPIHFLPEFDNVLDKEVFTEYFKSVFALFDYDVSNDELTYETYYNSINGPESFGKTVDEFYIPEEKDELRYIRINFNSEYANFGLWENCYARVDYNEKRQVEGITLNFNRTPPEESFVLTDEEVIDIFFDTYGRDNKTLDTIDGKYAIKYEDGSAEIYDCMEYLLFDDRVCVRVTMLDVLPGGASCGLSYYIFPSDVTFP